MGRRLDLDGSFEVAARRAAARVEGDEAREDESRHGADGGRDDQAGVVAAAGRLLLCGKTMPFSNLVLVLLGFIFSEPSFKNQGFQVLSKFAGRLSSRKPGCGLFGG